MNIENELQITMNQFKENNPPSMFKDKNLYADWLAQTYYFVCHSTALLGYALPHLKNSQLRHHFEHHMTEENKHELLALKDLERLGMDIKDFPEHASTQAFYHSQYYRINFEGGTSLLGYILFLEGMAAYCGKEIYHQVKDVHMGSTLFMKVHADEDPHHLEGAIKTILALPSQEQEAIMRNFHYSAEIYQQIILSLKVSKTCSQAA